MAASLSFYANIGDTDVEETVINHVNGDGLGFYGFGFGQSVAVGSVQNSTYVVNSTGTESRLLCSNTAKVDVGSTSEAGTVQVLGESAPISLANLPNYLCPLNIRFTNDEPVKVTNCKLRIFDRTDPDLQAQGVKTYVYEARHPVASLSSTGLTFRARQNYHSWVTFGEGILEVDGEDFSDGAGALSRPLEMPLTPSPGENGKNSADPDGLELTGPDGTFLGEDHSSLTHDWYIAISAEPTSIGSKQDYGLYFTLEYLA
jgi:hypothetical protein